MPQHRSTSPSDPARWEANRITPGAPVRALPEEGVPDPYSSTIILNFPSQIPRGARIQITINLQNDEPPRVEPVMPRPSANAVVDAEGQVELGARIDGPPRKVREWAREVQGVSERELRRAMDDGTIAYTRKGSGKDHEARLVSPQAMIEYLKQRDAR